MCKIRCAVNRRHGNVVSRQGISVQIERRTEYVIYKETDDNVVETKKIRLLNATHDDKMVLSRAPCQDIMKNKCSLFICSVCIH
jgi:hypothetical protein